MKRKLGFLFVCLFIGCGPMSKSKGDDLIFLGTVEDIYVSPLPQSTLNWVVQCRVDKVVSGAFSGKTFSFRVHSPSKSRLELGKQFRVEAKRVTEGYAVDPFQWSKSVGDI